jgi:hypothetical protein
MQALGRTPKWDPVGEIIAKIQLRDTLVRDVLGWFVGIIVVNIALYFK